MDRQSRGLDLGGTGVGPGRIALVVGLVFAVALAVVVAYRMSAEAMAVVVGVVCGVAAGIPTSVLLLVVLSQRDRHRLEELQREHRAGSSAPVVVIQGGMPQALTPGSQAGFWPASPPGPATQRQFHVVGGDDLIEDDWQY